MAKSQSTSQNKTKNTKAKTSTKKTGAKSKATSAKRTATRTKRATTSKAAAPASRTYYFDQMILKAPRLVFGLYLAVVIGLLSYGKSYLQATLANEIFSQATASLYVYWAGLLDVLLISGLIALVALPAYGYYRRFGLRTLGAAFVVAFLFLSVVLAGLGFYVDSQPEPEIPSLQQQLDAQ